VAQNTIVATSFLYLTVHRRIVGDVTIYLKFVLKVNHPIKKRRFRQISLNSASDVRASAGITEARIVKFLKLLKGRHMTPKIAVVMVT